MIRIRRVWASAFLAAATLPVAAGVAQATPAESAEPVDKPLATQEAQQVPAATDEGKTPADADKGKVPAEGQDAEQKPATNEENAQHHEADDAEKPATDDSEQQGLTEKEKEQAALDISQQMMQHPFGLFGEAFGTGSANSLADLGGGGLLPLPGL
ncbi:hypothetical protein [Saccharomonospora saliphila]|uniref:hypothetical protein n=1 Tax=Saccharomonospora saliphila TaxID=369829 RepID=UPI00037821A6|nr:hypothetical protein [Saccharomonospora saliphila]